MIRRGQLRWADLGPRRGSAPMGRRPVLVVQGDRFNASRLNSVVVAALTTNTALADLPGNVFLPAGRSGLPKDSVVNVTAVTAVDRSFLEEEVLGRVDEVTMRDVASGLKLVLAL